MTAPTTTLFSQALAELHKGRHDDAHVYALLSIAEALQRVATTMREREAAARLLNGTGRR